MAEQNPISYHIRVESSKDGAIGEFDCDSFMLAVNEARDEDNEPITQMVTRGLNGFERLGMAHWAVQSFLDDTAVATHDGDTEGCDGN